MKNRKLITIAAGLLMGAVQAASAAVASSYTLQATPVSPVANPYTTFALPTFGYGTQNASILSGSVVASNGTWYSSSGMAILRESGKGQMIFMFNPAQASAGLVPVGLSSYYASPPAFYANYMGSNEAGTVSGFNYTSNGIDAWTYYTPVGTATATTVVVPTNVGALSDPIYFWASGSVQLHNAYAVAVNASGLTGGYSYRYAENTGYGLGQDAWIDDPNSAAGATLIPSLDPTGNTYTGIVNLYGPTFTYQSSVVRAINNAGTVVGSSFRYLGNNSGSVSAPSNYGQDAWAYTSSGGVKQIGLVGLSTQGGESFTVTGTETSVAIAINPQGTIAGYSDVYDYAPAGTLATNLYAHGQIGWLYTPASAALATTATVNDIGTQRVITDSNGGKYVRVGLTSVGYNNIYGKETTTIVYVNDKGQACGYSNRYNTSFVQVGQDAWYDGGDGNSQLILPTTSGASFSYSYGTSGNMIENSTITGMNNNKLVAGYTNRYTYGATTSSGGASIVLGQDAWVYDGATNKTYTVDVSTALTGATASNYAFSQIEYLSDTGIALGYYQTFSSAAGGTPTGTYLFAWAENGTATGNFVTLNQVLTDTNLADANWAALSHTFTMGSDGTIYGTGTTSSSVASIFALTPPAPVLLLGDANGDGKVDLSDLNIVLNNLGTTNSARSAGNFDGAATIDLTDLNDVLNNLGTSLPGVAGTVGTAVPEPASLGVLAVGVAVIFRRRRWMSM
jgi:hypothetical protein